MIYLTLGEAIRKGIPLYGGIHDNKPPLLYIMAAIAGNLFWFKAILAFWSLATITLFYKLSKALFPKAQKLRRIATIIFAVLTTIPLLEGNIANSEVFLIGLTIAGFLILLTKKLVPKNLILAGALFSAAALFKIPAVFDVPAIVFFWIVGSSLKTKKLKKIFVNTGYLALGFIIPIGLTFVWYFLRGALYEYWVAAFLQNFGYLSSWRPSDVVQPFFVRNAPLLIRAGVIVVGLVVLYLKKNKLSKQFIFITAWLLFSLFAVSLSERPYPHYLIQAVPSISFLLAILFAKKTLEQSLAIVPLALALFVPVYFRFWIYPTASYYVRFLKLATNQISKEAYINSFGGHVGKNYEIAEFVAASTSKDDKIFVWGDNSTIYALSRRLPPIKYVVDYHIKDFSSLDKTMEDLKRNPPKQVIILPNSSAFPGLIVYLRENYVLISTINGAEVWNQISPEVKATLAP